MTFINLDFENVNQFYKVLFDSVTDVVSINVRDSKGKFVYASEKFIDDLQLTPEYLIGKGSTELINEKFYGISSSEMSYQTGENAKKFFYANDGTLVYTESRVVRDNKGFIDYVVTVSLAPENVNKEISKLHGKIERYKNETRQLREILRKKDEKLIYNSPEMKELVKYCLRISKLNVGVLLTGESGVGKDVVAKMIHNNSPRKDKAFIPVCIPTISPSLLESELFGYAEGAFTGANRQGRMGLFEAANGGTVFLDEVGDIPIDLQVKLLRVLENREIYRVGSVKSKKLDIRVIAATNKDLKKLTREGSFREDLLYRLSPVHLKIKPLRKRKEDINVLSNHFINQFNQNYSLTKKLSSEARKILNSYCWPGNVRELKNILETLVILSEKDIITIDEMKSMLADDNDLLNHINGHPSNYILSLQNENKNKPEENIKSPSSKDLTIQEEFSNISRQKLLDALTKANGNRTKAADILGISRSKLYRKLKEFE